MMTNQPRILVGVNRSDPSRAAVEWAASRAERNDVGLTLVHVVDVGSQGMRSDWSEKVVERSGHWLAGEQKRVQNQHPTVEVDSEALIGDPAKVLIAYSVGSRMLVVGTHKTGYVQGRVFGSMALRLVGALTVPLAVIPQSWVRARSGVVVGVDAGLIDEALAFGVEEAQRLQQELILLHAWLPPEWAVESSESAIDSDLEAAAWELVSEASRRSLRESSTKVRVRAVRRPAAAALIDAATAANELIIGTSRGSDDDGGSLGAVVRDVMLNLTSPAIVVPLQHRNSILDGNAIEVATTQSARGEDPLGSDRPG